MQILEQWKDLQREALLEYLKKIVLKQKKQESSESIIYALKSVFKYLRLLEYLGTWKPGYTVEEGWEGGEVILTPPLSLNPNI